MVAASGGGYTVVDTLGNALISGSTSTSNYLRADGESAGSAGYIDTVWVYCSAGEVTTDSVRVGIYDDNTSYPDALLAESGWIGARITAGWLAIPLGNQVSITQGSVYYIAGQSDGIVVFYESGSDARFSASYSVLIDLPNPFPSGFTEGTTNYGFFAQIKVDN